MNSPPKIIIKSFGGKCPVQAEGTIDDKYFYFRSRGETMTFYVFNEYAFNWDHNWSTSSVTHPGTQYGAGFATDEEVEDFFQEAVIKYWENISS